jgi:hypothetical protein
MKKQETFYCILILLLGLGSSNAQTSKSEFQKTVDSINVIIKKNPKAYYTDHRKDSDFITKISATEQGIVSFTDSIPKPEIRTETPITDTTTPRKRELISDCSCHSTKTLDLFAVKQWEIYFPFAYLIDEKNERYARFLGFQKLDLEKLKEQFDKLTTLCKKKEAIPQ